MFRCLTLKYWNTSRKAEFSNTLFALLYVVFYSIFHIYIIRSLFSPESVNRFGNRLRLINETDLCYIVQNRSEMLKETTSQQNVSSKFAIQLNCMRFSWSKFERLSQWMLSKYDKYRFPFLLTFLVALIIRCPFMSGWIQFRMLYVLQKRRFLLPFFAFQKKKGKNTNE